ncbi:MAG: protein phosphatase 2C domain-containing protein, partial [Myxococcales bacterium]|nr:protein phosphatase 2C domain-containing protein [Myxococcales bacterium]
MRQSAGRTDIGQRRRTNQDAFLLDADLGLYVVADGMGGHAAGEVASQEAIATVHGMVQRESSRLECLEDPAPEAAALQAAARLLEGSIQAATYMIFAMAQHEPDQLGMGTTLSAM